ncbi:NahK/ErcS family hybrid sensor histidine kinase/response regulator [Terasakiella sp. A23]|uniref:NahK/ErcS family hybrid sensor histidine kinase/response regulator n=1 Tax=Terasakiella sp. FCG-A23 TaxID=3080561 RepID=UPI002952E00B|nr:NahK/ErcS family hybrid sensor histidine kinase/response regulator [Terasakiella sp. A23]MDV7339338.1 NahK/ErcS family hybrid sensor histidine kinase/response regulator [Terasakiella sp. A23]
MIEALDIPTGTPDEAQKLRKIVAALMKQVERTLDVQGGAFSSFQTATLLDEKVRERTTQLEQALGSLEKVNRELSRTKGEAETARIRLVEAVESVSEGFALYDKDDRLILCNHRFWEFWGDRRDQVPYGTRFEDVARTFVRQYVVPNEVDKSVDWLKERLNRHRNPKDAFVIQLRDGRWLKINERPTKDGGIVGVYTDITEIKQQEQKRREQELAEQNVLLQSTLDNLRQGVSVFDKDLKLVAWNQRFIEVLDLPDGLVEHGMSYERYTRYNVFRGEFGDKTEESYQKRMERARAKEALFFEYTRPNGRVVEVQRNTMPGGGFVTTYTDITARREAQEQLREAKENLEERVRERTDELHVAKEAAEEANLSKTRFLAAASHDLLQPLNAARLFISTLLERSLEDNNLQLVERADFALKGVESLLSALLEISKLDAGAVPVVIANFELSDLFNRLQEEYGPLAAQKDISLKVVASKAWVNSDAKLLSRILRNFVSNAVRYTENGRILIGAKRHGDVLRLCVYDTGPGISEADQERIFEEFRQLESKNSVAEKGAGLGLAIVKRIAQTLGHKVSLVSSPDQGACFIVEVPLVEKQVQQKAMPSIDKLGESLSGISVLVVDNEDDIQIGMKALMENWDVNVLTAGSQEEAIEVLDEFGTFPDAVIADYHLSETETGVELLSWLKRDRKLDFPAMVITADRTDELRASITSQGYALLNKPLKPAKLRAWLSHVVTPINY